ncbi:MAG: hypothetical protein LBI62_08030, partial [Candidatus Accumulibacter sp.]|nr:hypothetical protein [Accumulibacter sp.]
MIVRLPRFPIHEHLGDIIRATLVQTQKTAQTDPVPLYDIDVSIRFQKNEGHGFSPDDNPRAECRERDAVRVSHRRMR